ncbi:MAG: type II toxin-antitoxin system PemK/MazF family toxin [Patescibacteria group bacterium]
MNLENKYIKDFDLWNSKKKELEKRVLPDDFFFLEGEVWWAMLGINIGHEIDGKNELFERPILVFKKQDENMLLALPITSTMRGGEHFHKMKYKGSDRTLLLSQPRAISSKRLLRLIYRITNEEFVAIQSEMRPVLTPIKAIPSG